MGNEGNGVSQTEEEKGPGVARGSTEVEHKWGEGGVGWHPFPWKRRDEEIHKSSTSATRGITGPWAP